MALERLLARIDSIIDRTIAGEPIDHELERRVVDWETVRASLTYTQEAVDRVNEADSELDPRPA